MKTDRELIELAAKAAGLCWAQAVNAPPSLGLWLIDERRRWNPIKDDGDALRLAVNLGLQLDMRDPGTRAFGAPTGCIDEHHRTDPYAATRRAIVRAAAEIGEAMP